MNSECGIQTKRKCEGHESCVFIAGPSACGCQKKSVVYEMECRHVAVQKGKQRPGPFIALKHIQAILYLIGSDMGRQCSFSRRGVEWWWRGAKRNESSSKVSNKVF